MDTKDLIALGIFAMFVIYGVFNLIGLPILVRRFYTKYLFEDSGPSTLDTPTESLFLELLITKKLYLGEYRGNAISHAKAMLQKPSLFTFSKRKRKQLELRWSLTKIESEAPLVEFLLLPKNDPATLLLMVTEAGVDLSEDEAIDRRYFCRTDEPDAVIPVLRKELKDFLMERNLASIEAVGNTVIIKRIWPNEKFEQHTLAEFDAAIAIVDQMRT